MADITANNLLVEQKLAEWRLELFAAAQMLKGKHLEDFKQLITEIAQVVKLAVVKTDKFEKQEKE